MSRRTAMLEGASTHMLGTRTDTISSFSDRPGRRFIGQDDDDDAQSDVSERTKSKMSRRPRTQKSPKHNAPKPHAMRREYSTDGLTEHLSDPESRSTVRSFARREIGVSSELRAAMESSSDSSDGSDDEFISEELAPDSDDEF